MKKLFAFVLLSCLLAVGCAKQVPKNWTAIGGSRADATVEVAYDFIEATEIPVVNNANADQIAVERCKSWGYSSAEAFGGEKRSYQAYNIPITGMTNRILVTKTYQCIGKGDKEVKDNEVKGKEVKGK